MLPQSIIQKILSKYGKEKVYSADCASLADKIGLSETTLKRMLGLVGENSPERNRTPHVSTMDILAKWLGYDNYRELLKEIGENDYSSEFTFMESIDVKDLVVGTQLQIKWEPSRILVITCCGDDIFIINEAKNSKLLKGDKIKLTHLILGQELLIKEVWRGECMLGPYRGAKDGGLTSIEIIA